MKSMGYRRVSWLRSLAVACLCVLYLGLGGGLQVQAQAPTFRGDQSPEGRRWAILVGVEQYHRVSRLRHTINDIKRLSETLQQRGDYRPDCILEIVDTSPNSRFQPLRASLLAELPGWLSKVGPNDQVLVYFSGHGLCGEDGKLYLAPIDCNPDDLASTCIEVQWLREQIAACQARFKILVIDACHAGNEKGEADTPSVSAKDLGTPFKDLTGVFTLASCAAKEKSQIWEDMEQSLFSYWLNQGLRGHADQDGDGAITIDELYAHVYRNVTQTAKLHFPRAQTPVRITKPPGVPVVIRLKPQTLRQVLADVAEQLATDMTLQKLSKVGVLEFTNDTRLGELLGADFGLLGRFCAEELERQLMDQGMGKFSVVDRRRLQAVLKDRQFSVKDLGSSVAMKQLSKDAGGMPVIALGTLRNRTGRVVTLQCKLVRTESDELAGSAGGTAMLNESQWAMVGRSVAVKPEEDRLPEAPTAGQPARPVASTVVERLDRRSQGPHPLLIPIFPSGSRSPSTARSAKRYSGKTTCSWRWAKAKCIG